jgi:hypothetical protein
MRIGSAAGADPVPERLIAPRLPFNELTLSVLIGGAVKVTFPERFPVQFSLFPLWAHCAAAGVESSSARDSTTKGSKMSVAKSPAAKHIQRRLANLFPDVAAALECRSWITRYQRRCPPAKVRRSTATRVLADRNANACI